MERRNRKEKPAATVSRCRPATPINGSDTNPLIVFHSLNHKHRSVEQDFVMLGFGFQLIFFL